MPASEKTRLREAAEWFALLHGPDAEHSRGVFEAWLAASERNREAYSRIAETFSLGKNLKPADRTVAVPAAAQRRVHPGRRAVVAATLCIATVAGVLVLTGRDLMPARTASVPAVAAMSPLESAKTEIRSIQLADGSVVTLDADSRVRLAFTGTARDLWLERGRARFDVAHDNRPFTVHAGGGAVVARGTLFDVRLGAHRTDVTLLRGAVDVIPPRQGSAAPKVRRLRPGDAVALGFSGIVDLAPTATAAIVQPAWPQSLLEFETITVGDLIAEANRYSASPLRLADPALAARRVSGTFRVGDADRLARRLSTLLDAPVSRTPDGGVLLGEGAR